MKNFKSGNYVNQGTYKAFIPNPICRDWHLDDMEVIFLLSNADRLLGQLDMYSNYVNIDLYLKMHIAKEAKQSLIIEGTQTHIEDAFMKEENVSKEKRDDWEELQNYIAAMNEAMTQLHRLPFSNKLIKQTHKVLLMGVRGKNKLPGEYRMSQNWIGGATINDARFIPPPYIEVVNLMSDLEKFANDEQYKVPDLLKIALIHYQFETIHPFLDGNGRIGRLLITLYLVCKGLLKCPILYLSDFFEKHRELYYDNLTIVRTKNDINQWCKFFLTGIIETAKNGIETFDAILQLKRTIDMRLNNLGTRAKDVRKVLEELYQNPVIDAMRVEQIIEKTSPVAYKVISLMIKLKILKEITGGQWKRLYVFKEYVELF
jgi:Fic family protein